MAAMARGKGRAEQSVFLDGKQGAFADKYPPDPGFVFVNPRRSSQTSAPTWFEVPGSLTLDGWMRPRNLFIGTDIEGGVISCLVTDDKLASYSGFGVLVSGQQFRGNLLFKATVGSTQQTINSTISENTWYYFTAIFNRGSCTNQVCSPSSMSLYINSVRVASSTFQSSDGISFWPSNDLLIGKQFPIPSNLNSQQYFAGLLDEMRFWSRAVSTAEIPILQYSTIGLTTPVATSLQAYWNFNEVDVFSFPLFLLTSFHFLPCFGNVMSGGLYARPLQGWQSALGTDSGWFLHFAVKPLKFAAMPSLAVSSYVNVTAAIPVEINSCGNSPPDNMRWSKSNLEAGGQLRPASRFEACLSIDAVGPWDGMNIYIANCIQGATNQQWEITATGQIRSQLTGTCLTVELTFAVLAQSGSSVYIIDCYDFQIGAVPFIALDVMNRHHGSFKGTAKFSTLGDSLGCCAPIDTPPEVISIGADNVVAGQDIVIAGAIGKTITVEVLARDKNVNDGVTIMMLVPPSADAVFAPFDTALNPRVYTFTWRPLLSTNWTNPTYAVFQAFDTPTNEYNASDPADRAFSLRASLRIEIRIPPLLVSPTPVDGTVFTVNFGSQLSFTVSVETRDPTEVVRVDFVEAGQSWLLPPPSNVVIGPQVPTPTPTVNGMVDRYNPTSRTWTFAAEASDSGKTYEVCFYGSKVNVLGTDSRTEIRCVRIVIPMPRPVFLAGTTANNTNFTSLVGCGTYFDVLIGQNDTSTAYTVYVTPSHYVRFLFNGTGLVYNGLPPRARFVQTDVLGYSFNFSWDHDIGEEGQWIVCFELSDNVNISRVTRCVYINVPRCRRCIRAGDTLEKIVKLYGSSWIELFAVNPALNGNPDDLRPGDVLNVGVIYRIFSAKTLVEVSNQTRSTTRLIRLLNPDINSDVWSFQAYDRICILPAMCGDTCAGSANCDRP
ncbi:hypothetical protein GUITHDRAFT_135879 [Guillardia theta CCMP2712]|uniref:LysM domain-containing protein n=1 Tax=Guillardia theta (strain CCMP2712) TaxID=905079 RepID=L1JNQ9_GUITC|nr:hypothetical protein GUITHDRAFT_135879 [Guillardia theta CCMP2712]EKX49713.1 hypothetical protein GUITHDRAFT_135879 [Guillardia theta CCMP2712]|eukprot:XP_005836693.1 hypothetical protein GUITHDRAFT_135879 [Guillardia theta CCMP2712]